MLDMESCPLLDLVAARALATGTLHTLPSRPGSRSEVRRNSKTAAKVQPWGGHMTLRAREDLITDLNYLRKGEGLTLERLPNAPAVIDYCGGPDVPLSTIRTRLTTAVNSLRQHKGGPALRAAYGIDDHSPPSTTERRRRYAASIGRKPNTVLEWENSAIEELALVLITSYYAGAETPSGLVIPHGGFLIENLHVVTVIRDRSFFESHQTRRIISLVEGAAGFRYGTYSPTGLSLVTGATTDPPEQHEGGTMHTLRFPRKLRRGEAYTFSFREHVPPSAPDGTRRGGLDFSGQTFETPTLRYTVEVCFLGDVPSVVWAYDKLSRIERPGDPNSRASMNTQDRATVAVEFSELYGGLCSGLAWKW